MYNWMYNIFQGTKEDDCLYQARDKEMQGRRHSTQVRK